MLRRPGPRVDEVGSQVAQFPEPVKQRVSGPRIAGATHVRDDQIERLEADELQGLFRGRREDEPHTQRFESTSFVKVVVRPIIDPKDQRADQTPLEAWIRKCIRYRPRDGSGIAVRSTLGTVGNHSGSKGCRGFELLTTRSRLQAWRLEIEFTKIADEIRKARPESNEEEKNQSRPDNNTDQSGYRLEQLRHIIHARRPPPSVIKGRL